VRSTVFLGAVAAAVAFAPAASNAVPVASATVELEHRADNSRGFYVEGAYYYAALRRGSVPSPGASAARG
jgi:hypothetical protein